MDAPQRLAAVEAIRQAKAKYFRGVDTGDAELVRSILAEDCELDYRGCVTDPRSGVDLVPSMNVVLHGRASWRAASSQVVSVHHGHQSEVEITGDTTARAVWAMSDRLFLPPGGPYAQIVGYGYYHETYELQDGVWKIKTLRITRLRVEGRPAPRRDGNTR
jgi:hypothetical protein